MNEELLNKIKQDFYFIKYIISDNRKIAQYLKIDFAVGKEIVSILSACSESGQIEAKKSILSSLYVILDDALYKMITPGKLIEAIKIANNLIFISLINVKVISIKSRPRKKKKKVQLELDDIDIKEIIQQIPILSKNHVESKRYIRLISALLKKYKEISVEMEEKLLVAPEKSKIAIKKTFEDELNDIITSVKRQYFNIIQAIPELKAEYENKIIEQIDEEEDEVDQFFTLNFNILKQFYLKQLSDFTKLRSSLTYIKTEGFNVLSIITHLYKLKKQFMRTFEEEERSIFTFLSVNKIDVTQYNEMLFKIRDESIKYINEKFINPYGFS